MEQIDQNHVAFNGPDHSQYVFDSIADEGSMNLDFSPLPDLEPLRGSSITPNIQGQAQIDHLAPDRASRPAQRVPAMLQRKPGTVLRPGATTQSHTVVPPAKARAVTKQFGQATARFRLIEERFSKIEQQNHTLLRRLISVEKRMSEIQVGLQKAEEGHEEIAEMVKASVTFLNELNSDEAGVQRTEQHHY